MNQALRLFWNESLCLEGSYLPHIPLISQLVHLMKDMLHQRCLKHLLEARPE